MDLLEGIGVGIAGQARRLGTPTKADYRYILTTDTKAGTRERGTDGKTEINESPISTGS